LFLELLIYEGVKIGRREDWFEPVLKIHTPLFPRAVESESEGILGGFGVVKNVPTPI
jgi:hypothetical protein